MERGREGAVNRGFLLSKPCNVTRIYVGLVSSSKATLRRGLVHTHNQST